MSCPSCGYEKYLWFGVETSKCSKCGYVGADEEFFTDVLSEYIRVKNRLIAHIKVNIVKKSDRVWWARGKYKGREAKVLSVKWKAHKGLKVCIRVDTYRKDKKGFLADDMRLTYFDMSHFRKESEGSNG